MADLSHLLTGPVSAQPTTGKLDHLLTGGLTPAAPGPAPEEAAAQAAEGAAAQQAPLSPDDAVLGAWGRAAASRIARANSYGPLGAVMPELNAAWQGMKRGSYNFNDWLFRMSESIGDAIGLPPDSPMRGSTLRYLVEHGDPGDAPETLAEKVAFALGETPGQFAQMATVASTIAVAAPSGAWTLALPTVGFLEGRTPEERVRGTLWGTVNAVTMAGSNALPRIDRFGFNAMTNWLSALAQGASFEDALAAGITGGIVSLQGGNPETGTLVPTAAKAWLRKHFVGAGAPAMSSAEAATWLRDKAPEFIRAYYPDLAAKIEGDRLATILTAPDRAAARITANQGVEAQIHAAVNNLLPPALRKAPLADKFYALMTQTAEAKNVPEAELRMIATAYADGIVPQAIARLEGTKAAAAGTAREVRAAMRGERAAWKAEDAARAKALVETDRKGLPQPIPPEKSTLFGRAMEAVVNRNWRLEDAMRRFGSAGDAVIDRIRARGGMGERTGHDAYFLEKEVYSKLNGATERAAFETLLRTRADAGVLQLEKDLGKFDKANAWARAHGTREQHLAKLALIRDELGRASGASPEAVAKRFTELDLLADEVFRYNRSLLGEIRDAGLLPEPVYRRLLQYDWLTSDTVLPEGIAATFAARTTATPKVPLRRITSPSATVRNLDSQSLLIEHANRVRNEVSRNNISNAIAATAGKRAEISTRRTATATVPLKHFVNGEARTLYTTPEMRQLIDGIYERPIISAAASNTLSWFTGSKFVKPAATGVFNPLFAAKAFGFDFMRTWALDTKATWATNLPAYALQYARGVGRVAPEMLKYLRGQRSALVDGYLAADGGMSSSIAEDMLFSRRYLVEGSPGERLPNVNRRLRALGSVLTATRHGDMFARLVQYDQAMRSGMSSTDAAAYSRRYMDYGVKGRATPIIEPILPYFNAGVRGTASMVDAARRNPKLFARRSAELIFYAALANAVHGLVSGEAHNQLDDNARGRFLPLPSGLSYTDANGDPRHVVIPFWVDPSFAPHLQAGALIGDTLLRTMRQEPFDAQEAESRIVGAVGEAVRAMLPAGNRAGVLESPAAQATFELIFGKRVRFTGGKMEISDVYTGPLVPPGLEVNFAPNAENAVWQVLGRTLHDMGLDSPMGIGLGSPARMQAVATSLFPAQLVNSGLDVVGNAVAGGAATVSNEELAAERAAWEGTVAEMMRMPGLRTLFYLTDPKPNAIAEAHRLQLEQSAPYAAASRLADAEVQHFRYGVTDIPAMAQRLNAGIPDAQLAARFIDYVVNRGVEQRIADTLALRGTPHLPPMGALVRVGLNDKYDTPEAKAEWLFGYYANAAHDPELAARVDADILKIVGAMRGFGPAAAAYVKRRDAFERDRAADERTQRAALPR